SWWLRPGSSRWSRSTSPGSSSRRHGAGSGSPESSSPGCEPPSAAPPSTSSSATEGTWWPRSSQGFSGAPCSSPSPRPGSCCAALPRRGEQQASEAPLFEKGDLLVAEATCHGSLLVGGRPCVGGELPEQVWMPAWPLHAERRPERMDHRLERV